ncbi:hypothetical protein AFLA_011695 [Aspergillus flavus NRRL3357]|nr:hypothetical protein AFLA_011695 [Aspergillus flavus NRRL3357]
MDSCQSVQSMRPGACALFRRTSEPRLVVGMKSEQSPVRLSRLFQSIVGSEGPKSPDELRYTSGNEVFVIGRYNDDFHFVRVVCGSTEIHLDLLEHWLLPTFASTTLGSPSPRTFC